MTHSWIENLQDVGGDVCLKWILTLLHFVWQGAIVGVVVAAVARTMRGKSPRARYFAHSAALFAMLAAIVLTFCVVEIPDDRAFARRATGHRETLMADRDTHASPVPDSTVTPALSPRDTTAPDQASPQQATSVAPSSTPARLSPSSLTRSWLTRSGLTRSGLTRSGLTVRIFNYAPWILAAYAVGVAYFVARLSIGMWGGQRLRVASCPIDDPKLLGIAVAQAQRMGLRFVPIIAFCERVTVPTVVGLVRPVVLLPGSLITGLTPNQLATILSHELAHIRRLDLFVNLLQRMVESLLFFHPVVWYVSHRLSAERELCCDDLVVSSGHERVDYVDALLRMAEISLATRRHASATLAATGDTHTDLELRIRRLLGLQSSTPRLTRSGFLVTATIVISVAASLVLLGARGEAHDVAPPATAGTATPDDEKSTEQNDEEKDRDAALESDSDDLEAQNFIDRMANQKKGGFGRPRIHTINEDGNVVELRLPRKKLDEGDSKIIGRLKHLEKLDLMYSDINDEQLGALSGLTNLRELILFDAPISDKGVRQLRDLPNLERLNLGDTKVTDKILLRLRQFKKLKHLSLSRCAITDDGVRNLLQLPQLESVELSETMVTNAAIESILKLEKLRGLTLEDTKVTDKGLEKLATDERFAWIATPEKTITEFVKRMEQGDFEGVYMMETIGLHMPTRGKFRLTQADEIEQTDRERESGRQRFRVELHWTYAPDRIDDGLYAVVSIDRGSLSIQRMGIIQPEDQADKSTKKTANNPTKKPTEKPTGGDAPQGNENAKAPTRFGYVRHQDAAAAIEKYKPSWSADKEQPIQLGIGVLADKRHFRNGERLELAMFVRNVSDQNIRVSLPAEFLWNAPKVHDSDGKAVKIERVLARGAVAVYREVLEPGESFGFRHLGVGFGDNPKPGKQNWYPYWKEPVEGAYQIHHEHSIRVEPVDDDGKSKSFDVVSGALDFVVAD